MPVSRAGINPAPGAGCSDAGLRLFCECAKTCRENRRSKVGAPQRYADERVALPCEGKSPCRAIAGEARERSGLHDRALSFGNPDSAHPSPKRAKTRSVKKSSSTVLTVLGGLAYKPPIETAPPLSGAFFFAS
jgi:hypothetical protein